MPLVKAKKPSIDSAISYRDDDWVMPRVKKTDFKAMDWIRIHQGELEKKTNLHPDFLEACGKANTNPTQEFRELLQKLVSPPDEFWQNFAKTFEQSVSMQLSLRLPVGSMQTSETIAENTLFSSFARMIKKPLVMTI